MREYLKHLREEKGLTQESLAIKMRLSRAYYVRIENGQRQKNISLDLLSKLAVVFNVPVTDLIAEETKLQSTAI